MNLETFNNLILPQGYFLLSVSLEKPPMRDPAGRTALARSVIEGRRIAVSLCSSLSAEQVSISIYHELLEAMTVAVPVPPDSVTDFIESDFERAAIEAHADLGFATPEKMLHFLETYRF